MVAAVTSAFLAALAPNSSLASSNQLEEQKAPVERAFAGAFSCLLAGWVLESPRRTLSAMFGGVAERLKALVLKISDSQESQGSNPCPSA